MPSTIFLIMILVSVPMDRDYFVRPLEAKYHSAYSSQTECDKAAAPLSRAIKGKFIASVLVKAVKCIPAPIAEPKP